MCALKLSSSSREEWEKAWRDVGIGIKEVWGRGIREQWEEAWEMRGGMVGGVEAREKMSYCQQKAGKMISTCIIECKF